MNKLSDIKNHDHARIQEEDFNLIRDTAKGVYVEVGTFHGASAYAASQNARYVYTVDIYEWLPHLFEGLKKVSFCKGTAIDFSENFDSKIDVLFIDGSHEFDYVKKDIEALVPLVKSGGIIMFHDYNDNHDTGVKRAVNEAIEEYGLKIIKEPSGGSSILMVEK